MDCDWPSYSWNVFPSNRQDTKTSKYRNPDIAIVFDYYKYLTKIHEKGLWETIIFTHTALFSSSYPIDLLLSILYRSVLMIFNKRHNESDILAGIIYLNRLPSIQCKPWSISGNDGDENSSEACEDMWHWHLMVKHWI